MLCPRHPAGENYHAHAVGGCLVRDEIGADGDAVRTRDRFFTDADRPHLTPRTAEHIDGRQRFDLFEAVGEQNINHNNVTSEISGETGRRFFARPEKIIRPKNGGRASRAIRLW